MSKRIPKIIRHYLTLFGKRWRFGRIQFLSRELKAQSLDLTNESGYVGSSEAHLRSGYAVMFDIRRKVLVVGISALQGRIGWMRLRIIPVKLLFSSPDLVAIPINCSRQAVEDESLTDNETQATIKMELSGHASKRCTTPYKGQRGMANRGKGVNECVKKKLIILGGP